MRGARVGSLLLVLATWVAACVTSPRLVRPPLAQAQRLALFDPQAQVEGGPPRDPLSKVEVLDVRPRDVSRGQPIVLRFTGAVASPDALPSASLVLERQLGDGSWRHVEGRSSWSRPDRLVFDPDAEIAAASRYRVRLEGTVPSPDGDDVTDVRWEFATSPPRVGLVEDYDEQWEWLAPGKPVLLWVDQPVSLSTLRRHLRVTASDGRKLQVRVRRPPDDDDAGYGYSAPAGAELVEVHPATTWPRGDTLNVSIDAGLRGLAGPRTIGEPWSARVRTRDRFRVLGLACPERDGSRCPLGPITVRLSAGPEDTRGVRIVPEPRELKVTQSYDESASGLEIEADFEPGTRYRIVLPRSLEDVYEQRLTGRRTIAVQFTEIRAPGEASLTLSDHKGIYRSVEEARVGLLAHRVVEAEIRVAVLSPTAALPFLLADRLDALDWPTSGRQRVVVRRLDPGRRHRYVRVPLDLSRFAKAGDVVLVETRATQLAPRTVGEPPKPQRGLYRISGLGVFAHSGPARGIVRVTDLETGKPRAGAAVSLVSKGKVQRLGATNRHGVVALPGAIRLPESAAILARSGDKSDAVAVPLAPYGWSVGDGRDRVRITRQGTPIIRRAKDVYARPPKPLRRGESASVAIAVGRGLYMPGETAHVAGWAGVSTVYGDSNSRRLPRGTVVQLRLRHGKDEIVKGEARVNAHGRFSTELALPDGARLGRYVLEAELLGSRHATSFDLAQPRIPAFEVTAVPKAEELRRGETIVVDVGAAYLSGELAPIREVNWSVTCSKSSLWWLPLDDGFSVRTDAAIPTHGDRGTIPGVRRSHVTASIATDALDHRAGRSCWISVSATDASFQMIGADARVLVHPGPGYVAVAMKRIEVGESLRPRVLLVSNTGRRIAGDAVSMTLRRWKDGKPRKSVRSCETTVRAKGPAGSCRFARLPVGEYALFVEATVDGSPLETMRRLWVRKRSRRRMRRLATPSPPSPPSVPPFELKVAHRLEADAPAPVIIRGPWKRASGVLTVGQTGLRNTYPFELRGGKAKVVVRPRTGAGPRLDLTAHVALPIDGRGTERVETATGWADIEEHRDLRLEVVAPARARPGTRTMLRFKVRDHAKRPVDARLAIWVVDDAIHQLRAGRLPNLPRIFNPYRQYEYTITDGYRELLEPFAPFRFGGRAKRVPRVRQAKAMVKGALDPEIRRKFEPVPLFVGDIGTGPDGEVAVPLQLPDNLTRFRITAVASAPLAGAGAMPSGPARFGFGKAEIEVTAPLNVRAALPRVLRPGDAAEVAALISVPTTGRLEVAASVKGKRTAVRLRGPAKRTRRVQRGDVVRVPFDVSALVHGANTIRFVATLHPDGGGKRRSGGVERALEVEVERTAVERAAVYGSVNADRPVALPVRLPDGAQRGYGKVEVAVSNTVLGELDDAAQFLVDYPYGCLEQTASRVVPLIALRALAKRLPDSVPDPAAMMSQAVARITSMQLSDGAFAYWPGGSEPAHLASAYATWVLLMARDAGHVVPESVLARAITALTRRATQRLAPTSFGRAQVLVERAFAARALAQGGSAPSEVLDSLWDHRDELPTFAHLLLLQAIHLQNARDRRVGPLVEALGAMIEERPAAAHVVDHSDTGGQWWFSFSSPTRTDALALQTLLQVRPDDPRVAKLARGLRERRRGGSWRTTQENAFALLALSGYAKQHEAVRPDHRVQTWIGERRVLDARVRGFDRTQRIGRIGLGTLRASTGADRAAHVVLQRTGRGRAYYRVGVEWAPVAAPPRAQGIKLARRIVGASDGAVAGERYAIRVELGTDTPQRYVAVEIPLPAGLEAVDTRLGAGARARVVGDQATSPLLSHHELRPGRVVLFFDELPPGTTVHTIPVLAATPGEYTIPAAVAEAMYEPEIRARTRPSKITVRR